MDFPDERTRGGDPQAVTLDLARIIAKLNTLAAETQARTDRNRFDALDVAWSEFDPHEVQRRLAGARTSFLVARGDVHPGSSVPEPLLPFDHRVVATDGSMILPNRHSPARFYILNIGTVQLAYGAHPNAQLSTEPTLHYGDDEMIVPNDPRRLVLTETTLGLLRAVRELQAALAVAVHDLPTVVLQDGTLLLWRLESQPDSVCEWILDPFVKCLGEFQRHNVPLASYISAPGSSDLMNALRIAVCDYPAQGRAIDCDHCRARQFSENRAPACDVLPMITDRALLADVRRLSPGSRTPVYRSSSKIVSEYVKREGAGLEICFFYLHTGREIARVEAPRYVTDDAAMLDLVHATLLEQCRLGRGYPVALQEAHELAVIGMDDRRTVELAVEQALARAGVVLTWTGKDGSKRGRFV